MQKAKLFKTLSLVVCLLLFILISIGCGIKQNSTALKEPIKIGFMSPLSGDPAIIGVQQMNSVKLAIEEINSQGGVDGQILEVVYEDSKCDSKQAVNAASKLINVDQVKIILGGICSSEVLGAKELIEQNKIINFCWGSSPEITKDSDYIFRNSPSDQIAGTQLAGFIYQNDYTQIGILTVNNDFTNTLFGPFKKEFTSLGGQILVEEVNSVDTKDYRTSIFKIQEKNPPALIFLHTDPKNTGLMAKQIRDQGFRAQLFSAYTFSSPDAIEAAGRENVRGLIYIDTPNLDTSNQTAQNFIDNYQSKYDDQFPGGEFYAAAAYDSVYIIAKAIDLCGQKTDCLREILKGIQFEGALGKYSIDENGDVVGVEYSIRTIE